MSEQIAEEQQRDEEGDGKHRCPECGKHFKSPVSLGMHRSSAHGVQGRNARSQERAARGVGGSKGAEINRLRRELKKDANALALLPFMAKGTAERLMNPAVTQTIEQKAEAFADAWIAVAEQNDFVRANLGRALAGGVWLNAAAQTAAFGYVVAVFSGFTPLHPGALMLMPEMAQFVYQPKADENGGVPNGAEVA